MIKIVILMFMSIWHSGHADSCVPRNDSITNQFLGILFNASMDEVLEIAKNVQQVQIPCKEITFLLYTKGSKTPEPIDINKKVLNCAHDIIIMIHGWTNDGKMLWIKEMSRAYLETNSKKTLISIDWSNVANQSYTYAVGATRSVGEVAAEMFLKIINSNVRCLLKTHLIGHSLGAHVAGAFGQKLKNKTGVLPDRITGLDAAAPLFTVPICVQENNRLSRDDGVFVVLIHTNVLLQGQTNPDGLVDIYFNCGGPIQPSCRQDNTTIEGLAIAASCSHHKSHEYYISSIRNETSYIGHRCSITSEHGISNGERVLAGEYISRSSNGNYCVSLNDTEEVDRHHSDDDGQDHRNHNKNDNFPKCSL